MKPCRVSIGLYRCAIGPLLMFEPGVAISVDERRFPLEAICCASGVVSAGRGAPNGGQQHINEQRHRADHDP